MKYVLIVLIVVINGYILYAKLIDYISEKTSNNLINFLKDAKLVRK